jgi:hypothetical protein
MKKNLLHQKTVPIFKEQNGEVLHTEHSLVWRCHMDASESRSQTPWKFCNVVLEKEGEYHLDGSCENKAILHSCGEKEQPTYNTEKEG